MSILLGDYKINHLYITGCATDFCVSATVHSALVNDFNLTIIEDCHTTADRPNIKAEENIKFHNWLWQNLTPTNGTIRIVNSNDIKYVHLNEKLHLDYCEIRKDKKLV